MKTAFVTCCGLYEFIVMPFALVWAPSTFERCMETVLRQLQWQTCLVYLDDVIVFSSDFQRREVLLRIKSAGLKLKAAKCHFFRKQVAFLGHVVSEEGIATDPKKIHGLPYRHWGMSIGYRCFRCRHWCCFKPDTGRQTLHNCLSQSILEESRTQVLCNQKGIIAN